MAPSEHWQSFDFYTIAFTLRSGSNVLCDYLTTNGLGLPAEYFQPPLGVMNKNWYDAVEAPTDDFAQFYTKIIRARSQNNIFGSKLTWDHKNAFAEALADARLGGQDALFPKDKWIYMYRQDKVAQAVSLWKAHKTGVWSTAERQELPPLEYNFAELMNCLMAFSTEEYLWKRYFETRNISYLPVSYESMMDDPAGTVYQIYRHIWPKFSLKKRHIRLGTTHTVQRDEKSAQFKARFLEDLHRLGTRNPP
jgi:LPS sulfotransferase NodH